jgi:pilus assembly protein Flp/PilA
MLKFVVFLQNFVAEPLRGDDRGATAVEYGLIVALIAAVIVGGLVAVGTNISGTLNNIATHI